MTKLTEKFDAQLIKALLSASPKPETPALFKQYDEKVSEQLWGAPKPEKAEPVAQESQCFMCGGKGEYTIVGEKMNEAFEKAVIEHLGPIADSGDINLMMKTMFRAGMLAAAEICDAKGKEFTKPDYKATYILCAAAIREAAKK